MLDLRLLQSFVMVAEELHFARAAARLHLTPPALSQHVRTLERQVGVRLLERDNRSVALTVAGAALLDDARELLEQASLTSERARQLGSGAATRPALRVGVSPHVRDGLLAAGLLAVRAAYPALTVRTTVAPPAGLAADLRRRRLDVSVVTGAHPDRGVRVTTVCHEPLGVLTARAHRLTDRTAVTAADLTGEHVVVMPREVDPQLHAAVLDLLGGLGGGVEVSEVEHPPHVFELVTAGAVALTVSRRLDLLPEVAWRPLAGEPLYATTYVLRPEQGGRPEVDLMVAAVHAAVPGELSGRSGSSTPSGGRQ